MNTARQDAFEKLFPVTHIGRFGPNDDIFTMAPQQPGAYPSQANGKEVDVYLKPPATAAPVRTRYWNMNPKPAEPKYQTISDLAFELRSRLIGLRTSEQAMELMRNLNAGQYDGLGQQLVVISTLGAMHVYKAILGKEIATFEAARKTREAEERRKVAEQLATMKRIEDRRLDHHASQVPVAEAMRQTLEAGINLRNEQRRVEIVEFLEGNDDWLYLEATLQIDSNLKLTTGTRIERRIETFPDTHQLYGWELHVAVDTDYGCTHAHLWRKAKNGTQKA